MSIAVLVRPLSTPVTLCSSIRWVASFCSTEKNCTRLDSTRCPILYPSSCM